MFVNDLLPTIDILLDSNFPLKDDIKAVDRVTFSDYDRTASRPYDQTVFHYILYYLWVAKLDKLLKVLDAQQFF